MKRYLLLLVSGGLVFASGLNTAVADDHENSAVPVELFACSYHDGKGPADLEKAIAKWSKWADDKGMSDYTAWTLTPYYSGPEQDFDVLWLGIADSAASMGASQDMWLATGDEAGEEFAKAISCSAHTLMAAVEFKAPPERDDPDNIVIAFSDCNVGDDYTFDADVAPALKGWGEFRESHGSTAGIWALFPVYGGGGEEFDFKYVTGHGSHEEQGADFDNWSGEKARELFPKGMVSCDSSRSYIARNHRWAESDEE